MCRLHHDVFLYLWYSPRSSPSASLLLSILFFRASLSLKLWFHSCRGDKFLSSSLSYCHSRLEVYLTLHSHYSPNSLFFLYQRYLELNFSKCELFINENCDYLISELINLAPNLKIVSKKNLTLLGAPVFEESFNSFFDDKIQNFTHKVDNLKIISKHSAYFIIRHCLFVPNFMYVLRCSPLWRHSNILNVLDSTIRQSLTSILNLPFDFEDRTWTQATLPIRLGGLGIRKISDVALPAFLSSVYSTVDLIGKLINPSLSDFEVPYLAEARNAWSLACPSQNYPVEPKSQKLWDGPLSKLVYKNLLSTSVNEAERARLLAVSKWESGLWLQALPSSNLGTLLDDTTFRIAASIRLGAPTVVPHHCQCGDKVGGSGHHGLSCVRSAGRIPRHAALNDIIRRALVTTGTPAILEPNGLCRDDGKRPDGMSLVPWKMGRPLVWDATCVDTLAASHLPDTAVVAGAAAARQEDLKRRKYASVGSGYIFAAFGVETLGPWGPEAHRLYRDLSKRLIDVSRNQNAGLYFGQRISVAIQRGNAASVLGTTLCLSKEMSPSYDETTAAYDVLRPPFSLLPVKKVLCNFMLCNCVIEIKVILNNRHNLLLKNILSIHNIYNLGIPREFSREWFKVFSIHKEHCGMVDEKTCRRLPNAAQPNWILLLASLSRPCLPTWIFCPRYTYSCTTSRGEPSTFTGLGMTCSLNMTFVLSKFMPRPTRREDSFRLFSMSVSPSNVSAKTTISSAKRRWEMRSPLMLMPRSFHSRVLKTSSIALVNSFGDMTSPCLTPRRRGIGFALRSWI
ncbi:hypothetical protein K1T71_004652 [Dendrolimus kikuchii]|uniref:Uncharacterized protein n=1 Tax=Dendrolimus kikuchii TaxID=765133 RepID=A0ACC1D8R0_9NEOP|nr:hypothetical protein K1T71_004652 [Dendrolimus kikuchii]